MTRALVVLAACASALNAACSTPSAPSGATRPLVETSPEVREEPLTQERVVLDLRDDAVALSGRVQAAPADTDADRVIVLDAHEAWAVIDPALSGAHVLDARFVDDAVVEDAVVTLGSDHVLRVHRAGSSSALDAQAEAPLSVAGHLVAYARGDMPLFELARADLHTQSVTVWTEGMAPLWSPALSEDGTSAIFVSGVSGEPQLYRVDGSGAPVMLEGVAQFPSSLRAPRWVGSSLHFEDESGHALTLDVETRQVVTAEAPPSAVTR